MDEELKLCPDCDTQKPLTSFYRSRKGLDTYCKECRGRRGREWHENNREQHQKLVRAWHLNNPDKIRTSKRKARNATRSTLQEHKEAKPCADCGLYFPYWVMQFDHLPGTSKRAKVSRLASRFTSQVQVQDEVAKCDLVCAVCHAHRTYCRQHQLEHYVLK